MEKKYLLNNESWTKNQRYKEATKEEIINIMRHKDTIFGVIIIILMIIVILAGTFAVYTDENSISKNRVYNLANELCNSKGLGVSMDTRFFKDGDIFLMCKNASIWIQGG